MTTLDAARPLRVTQALVIAGFVSQAFGTQEDLDRGSAVHKTTEFIDRGLAFEASNDEKVARRVEQYRRFLAEVRPEILSIEEEVRHDLYGYAGRLDRRIIIENRCGRREGVLDIKGVAESPWHGPQLALYVFTFDRPLARWNLYLHDDRYIFTERAEWKDFEVAKAALTVARFRMEHGLA